MMPHRRQCTERQVWAHRMGERIRRRRAFLGISRIDLARRSGLSKSTIEAYEVGRNLPTPEALRRICAAMGEPLEDEHEDVCGETHPIFAVDPEGEIAPHFDI